MQIVITGTTGFIGSNLKLCLVSQGLTVVELNRKTIGQRSFTFTGEISRNCSGQVWVHLAGKSKDLSKPKLKDEYQFANVELTKKVFNAFIEDETATIFIFVSSVKAAASHVENILTEEDEFDVDIPYGWSKRLAEKFLLSTNLKEGKKLIILRPCMIIGNNAKGNLSSLYSFIKHGLPYPFASFNNLRSLLSIENFNYVILEIINNPQFKQGIYNVADDGVISTTEIIELIGKSINKKPFILFVPKAIIKQLAFLGDKLFLPFNTNMINKLTDNYVVSNNKLLSELKKSLPYSTRESLFKMFTSDKKK